MASAGRRHATTCFSARQALSPTKRIDGCKERIEGSKRIARNVWRTVEITRAIEGVQCRCDVGFAPATSAPTEALGSRCGGITRHVVRHREAGTGRSNRSGGGGGIRQSRCHVLLQIASGNHVDGRRLPSQIIIEGGQTLAGKVFELRFNKTTGKSVGSGDWAATWIRPDSVERREKWQIVLLKSKAIKYMGWLQIPNDIPTLDALITALEPFINKETKKGI